jgi:hypothetical protein
VVGEGHWRLKAFSNLPVLKPQSRSAKKHELVPHYLTARAAWKEHKTTLAEPSQPFFNKSGAFDPEAGSKDHNDLGIPRIPCSLAYGKTFKSLQDATMHMFIPGLGHCVNYNKDRFPACPMSPEHTFAECQHYKNIANIDDKGNHSVHLENKSHLDERPGNEVGSWIGCPSAVGD